jgi:hypothetical protein
VIGSLLLAGTSFAGTITQTFTVPTGSTEITDAASNRAFNYFGAYNLAGQVLTGVTLQFTGFEQLTSLTITNSGSTQQYYTEAIVGNMLLSSINNENGNGAGALGDSGALTQLSNSGFGFGGNLWAIGSAGCQMGIGSGVTQHWVANSTADPTAPSLTGAGQNPSTLATCTPPLQSANGLFSVNSGVVNGNASFYQGNGQFNLSFLTTTSGSFTNSNINSGVLSATVASGTYTVIYTYGAAGAPEPGTILLVGSGLIAAGLIRRRVRA